MDEMTFESALSRIEEIAGLLSGEQVPLKDVVSYFEEASRLIEFCDNTLKTSELKIEEFAGKMSLGEF